MGTYFLIRVANTDAGDRISFLLILTSQKIYVNYSVDLLMHLSYKAVVLFVSYIDVIY